MFRWIKKNWFMTLIIGLVTYSIHLCIEYIIVDSVLKLMGVSLSII